LEVVVFRAWKSDQSDQSDQMDRNILKKIHLMDLKKFQKAPKNSLCLDRSTYWQTSTSSFRSSLAKYHRSMVYEFMSQYKDLHQAFISVQRVGCERPRGFSFDLNLSAWNLLLVG